MISLYDDEDEKIESNDRQQQVPFPILDDDTRDILEEMEELEQWHHAKTGSEDIDRLYSLGEPKSRDHRYDEVQHLRFEDPDDPLRIIHVAYEISEEKDILNVEEHGIHLKLGASVLSDPDLLRRYDDVHSDEKGEDRWNILGRVNVKQNRYLFVVYAQCLYKEEGLVYQIISARKALTEEKMLYDYLRYLRHRA